MARNRQAFIRFGKYAITQDSLNVIVGILYTVKDGKDKGMEKLNTNSQTYHASYEQALNNLYNRMLKDEMNNPQIDMVKKLEKSILKCKDEIMGKLQEYIDAE